VCVANVGHGVHAPHALEFAREAGRAPGAAQADRAVVLLRSWRAVVAGRRSLTGSPRPAEPLSESGTFQPRGTERRHEPGALDRGARSCASRSIRRRRGGQRSRRGDAPWAVLYEQVSARVELRLPRPARRQDRCGRPARRARAAPARGRGISFVMRTSSPHLRSRSRPSPRQALFAPRPVQKAAGALDDGHPAHV